MTSYKSKPAEVAKPIETLYAKLSDLSALGEQLSKLPSDQLAQAGNVKFENDQFIIVTPQIGEIAFAVIDKHPFDKIVFGTPSSPVPLQMVVNLEAVTSELTKVFTSINVEIPAFLRPMIGSKLQEAADKFGEMIANMAR